MRYGREEQINKEETYNSSQKVDLNNLMKKVRDQEKKSKRTSVYLSALAISAFAVFGIILTL
tara:strand:+ start:591 stop:776 length:186 start_codon:yes stop_codon:yes gene_type:complete